MRRSGSPAPLEPLLRARISDCVQLVTTRKKIPFESVIQQLKLQIIQLRHSQTDNVILIIPLRACQSTMITPAGRLPWRTSTADHRLIVACFFRIYRVISAAVSKVPNIHAPRIIVLIESQSVSLLHIWQQRHTVTAAPMEICTGDSCAVHPASNCAMAG